MTTLTARQARDFLESRKEKPSIDISHLDADYAIQVAQALMDAERETGIRSKITSGFRTPEHQAQLYADYKGQPIDYNGKTYLPARPGHQGTLAAEPGKSRHNSGIAADLGPDAIFPWLGANIRRYPLQRLPPTANEPWHVERPEGPKTRIDPLTNRLAKEGAYQDAVVFPGTANWRAVGALQAGLANRGYYTGPITGDFGPETAAALARYQQAVGKQVSSTINASELAELTGGLTPATAASLGYTNPEMPATKGLLRMEDPKFGASRSAGVVGESATSPFSTDTKNAGSFTRGNRSVGPNPYRFEPPAASPAPPPVPRPKPVFNPPLDNSAELNAPPPTAGVAASPPGAGSMGPVVKMAYPMPGKDVKQHGDDAAFDAAFPMHILDRMFAEKEAKAAPASSGYGTITPAVYGAIPADNSSAPGSSTYAADAATAPASPFKPDPLGLAVAKAMGPEAPAHMQKYLAQEPAEDFAANGNGYGVDPYAPQMTAQAAIDPFAGLHPEAVTALLRNLGFDPDPYA